MSPMYSPEDANAALVADLAWVTSWLRLYAGASDELVPARSASETSPLSRLKRIFSLTDFEGDVLLLAAAGELDAECAAIISNLQNGTGPSFSLALAALPDRHWSALLPDAPLRRWGLIRLSTATSVSRAELTVDERILHFLLGLESRDPFLSALIRPIEHALGVPKSLNPIKQRMIHNWESAEQTGTVPQDLLFFSADCEVVRALCATSAAQLGFNAIEVRLSDLPQGREDLRDLVKAVEREAMLASAWVLLDCATLDEETTSHLNQAMGEAQLPLFMYSRTPPMGEVRAVAIEVPVMNASERLEAWRNLFPGDPIDDDDLRRIAFQFRLSSEAMREAKDEALAAAKEGGDLAKPVWNACRDKARLEMPPAVERRQAQLGWDALILPAREKAALKTIAAQLQARARVHGEWQMGKGSAQGNGIAALLAGPSGTGKTLAAEALAHETGLDLYRIDLSLVISKYIGETEKNLRRIFDAAEHGGAVLLFDEADALFGKRSDVKSSNDRNANMEVSYLLQRIESYSGLAILTTNLKDNLDEAFLRRLRFIIEFPFPEAAERKGIWQLMLKSPVPIGAIDFDQLAQLSVAGGTIRNIALNAAFIAADENRAIEMADIQTASAQEYEKLGRAFGDDEWGSRYG